MDLRKILVQSRKLPAQNIEMLWDKTYVLNVRMESLQSILTFYLHHRVYPPPVQKAFDTLLVAFTDAKMSRKMVTLLFQTVEEISLWLSPSCVLDTVRLSTSTSVVAQLLPCLLINRHVPRLQHSVYERLISALTMTGLSHGDYCKLVGFLMSTVPAELVQSLNKQLVTWLSYSCTSQTTGSLFQSPDVTEVDGSPVMGISTSLTLVSVVTDRHILGVIAFSHMRRYLKWTQKCSDDGLINAVFGHCSSLLTQCSKKPASPHDKQLIPALLEEVVLVMAAVRRADDRYQGRCQLTVDNVQHLAEQLRLTTVLLSVWQYHLSYREESVLTDKILGSVIKAEFSQGTVSHRISTIAAEHGRKLAPRLSQHIPSLLKLVATHPSSLVQEFMDIVPNLNANHDLTVEVLHCLLDLPALSASICIHQTALLVQAGIKVPTLVSVRQVVETEHSQVYRHMLRSEARSGQTDKLLQLFPGFWSAVRPVLTLGLIEVTCQVAPLLLDTFLHSAFTCDVHSQILTALLSRVALLCPVPSYQKAVFDVVSQYIPEVTSTYPQLLDSPSVVQFLSVTSRTHLCPQLYKAIVTAVGEHVTRENTIVNMLETLEAALREMLTDSASRDVSLETCVCSTLAQLASRNVSLIPRAIATFEKMAQSPHGSVEERESFSQHIIDLIRILKNPRVASVLLSPSSKEDVAIAALMRVLFHFLD